VAYLDRLRQLELPKRAIELERDAWMLVAAQLSEQMPTLMALKHAQTDTPAVTADLPPTSSRRPTGRPTIRGYRRSPTGWCR
jgi:hypothetical protein